VKKLYKKVVKKLPYVREILEELTFYHQIQGFKPGSYYSPIIHPDELDDLIFVDENYEGINLNIDAQLILLNELKEYLIEFPFGDSKNNIYRYYTNNAFYTRNDALFLYGLIRKFKPNKIIEVGSGYSSALMLDTNSLYFEGKIDLTFIEPYPERLKELLFEKDKIDLIEKKVQTVSEEVFTSLNEGDMLFIDSSHISKTGSDLNFLVFNVLPKLKKGVIVHFHDVFHPFEYPKKWVLNEKRNWNECYFLKAFLMYNSNFRIILFNTLLMEKYTSWFKENLTLKYNDEIFGSIWMVKS
jgi:predicted O-methyltransferase YrrM